MVIIVVREVKSAIVVVVSDVVVDHNHGSPGVEKGVGDDGSEGRAADDVVSVHVAAVDSVVEVVGSAVVVNRSYTRGDVHVAVVVVVVRVYVGVVRGRASVMSGISMSVASSFVVVVAVLASSCCRSFRAGCRDGLRAGRSLGGISALLSGSWF